MNETRKQHVVPKMHLRHWADGGGKVWAYDIENDSLFNPNIINVCARRDYHEFQKDIELPYPIEEVFAEEIEGPAAPPLAKLAVGDVDNFDQEGLDNLSNYFGHQVARTPFFQKQMNKLAIELYQERGLAVLEDKTKFLTFKKMWHEQHSDKPFLTREELISSLKNKKISWKVEDNDFNLALMMISGKSTAESYMKQRWTLLIAGRGKQFIISDHPVVTVTSVSILGKRTETVIPLGPKTSLLLDRGGKFNGVNILHVGRSVVDEVNKRIATHADRTIISTNKQLLEKIVKVRKSNQEVLNEMDKNSPRDVLRRAPFKSISRSLFD